MEKYEKQIECCYRRMKYTLEQCAGVLETESDAELLCLIYENLVIDVRCDLSDANLKDLLDRNYIYPEIAQRIVGLRENMAELMDVRRTAVGIRNAKVWKTAADEATDIIGMLYI